VPARPRWQPNSRLLKLVADRIRELLPGRDRGRKVGSINIESYTGRGPQSVGQRDQQQTGIPFYVEASIQRYLRSLMSGPATSIGARLTVAAQARGGAGLTKLFTGSYVTPTRVKPMRTNVARAAVREAHRRGMIVLAHPSNKDGTAIAIEAGVDALTHLPDETEGTEALLQKAAAQGIRIIPTLSMFATTVTTDDAYLASIRAALRGFINAGGKVLFGTDVGYMTLRNTEAEFEALQASGLTAPEILQALTVEPAAFFNMPDVGRADVGKRGDLTVLQTAADTVDPRDSQGPRPDPRRPSPLPVVIHAPNNRDQTDVR
jgi:imidazolonepropionase-like amidohydrolase